MVTTAALALLLSAGGAQAAGSSPMSCEQLRAEADRLQGQMDGMITEVQEASLDSMRHSRAARGQQRATELLSNFPILGGLVADAVTAATEARGEQLEERSDRLSEQMVEAAPQLGRRLGDLEQAYEMQCRRPAAARARGVQP